jgi:PAS domain S-box-containing protein
LVTSKRVLVVDDDSNLRKTLSDILRHKGYAPEAVGTGELALERANMEAPVVALIDLRLEDMSGLEVMGKLKRHSPQTECIVLTGHASQASAIEAVNLGAYGYLVKPYNMDQLLINVQRAVEKREARQALLESQEFSAGLLNNSLHPIMVVNPDAAIRYVNPVLERLTGYSSAELVSRKPPYPWWTNRRRKQTGGDILERGKREELFKGKGGELFWVEVTSTPVTRNGEVVYHLSNWVDITERKMAGEAIRQRNRELALLNRVIAASAAGQDAETFLRSVCRALAEGFGVSRSTATLFNGEKTRAVKVAEYCSTTSQEDPGTAPGTATQPRHPGRGIPSEGPDTLESDPVHQYLLEQRAPLVSTDASVDRRLAATRELMRRRGTISYMLVPLVLEGETAGSLWLEASELRQFSEEEENLAQRVAEQVSGALARGRLEEAQRRLTTAVEQAAEAVVITDTNGTILYINPAFEQITGYSRADALGRHRRMLRSNKQDASVYDELWNTVSGGQAWHGRLVSKKKNGDLFTEETTIAPVFDQDREIVHYVATMRDVTGVLQLEEQFRQAQKMEAVGLLAGGIAHDFSNLLTVIRMSTWLLQRELTPDHPFWKRVQRIDERCEHGFALTKQLLTVSHREITEPQRLNLNTLIENLSSMLRRIIGEDIRLSIALEEPLWPVLMDPTQLDQTIMNLVVNARDAMPQGGTLTMNTTNVVLDEAYAARSVDVQPGEYVVLTIIDSGVGMDADVRARIFEPFFTTKEPGQGTGLGLATVFGIVKQNRGHIDVESEVGKGSRFRIYFPRADETADRAALRPRTSAEVRSVQGTETILLAEDDPAVREVTADILDLFGYNVLTSGSGMEALEISDGYDGPIHLLLSDIVMPGMSGPELRKQLKTRRPDTRVLYMSGYTDRERVHHGAMDDGTPILSKPVTQEGLTTRIRGLLDEGM